MPYIVKTVRILFVLILPALLLSGCGVYNPQVVHIPLLSQRGEVQLEGAALPTTGNQKAPADLRASLAWAVSDHLAVAASLDPFRNYTQGMAGFYFSQANNFVWELYVGAGWGWGRESNIGGREPWTIPEGSYRTVFLQADAGWLNLTRKGHLDLGFSLKAGPLEAWIRHGEMYTEADGSFAVKYTTVNSTSILLEPTAELRFGWERLKFNVKVGYCHLVSLHPAGYRLSHGRLAFGAGLSYRF